jgi:hypothetical protein
MEVAALIPVASLLPGKNEVDRAKRKQHRFNAFHYIIIGILGSFAGSFCGFVVAWCASPYSGPNPYVILLGGLIGAPGLPLLLWKFSDETGL